MKQDETKALQEEFKNDCTIIDFAEEYPGFTGSPRYLVSSHMSQKDLEQRYSILLDAIRPYIYDNGPMGDEIKRYRKNETKHLRRRQRGTLFTIDDAFEEHHPELAADQEVEKWELHDAFKKAIEQLSQPMQRRFVAVCIQGISARRLAISEGVSNQAMCKSIRLAKKKNKIHLRAGFRFALSQFIQVKGLFDTLRAP